jgi:hypothetical protein
MNLQMRFGKAPIEAALFVYLAELLFQFGGQRLKSFPRSHQPPGRADGLS